MLYWIADFDSLVALYKPLICDDHLAINKFQFSPKRFDVENYRSLWLNYEHNYRKNIRQKKGLCQRMQKQPTFDMLEKT